MAAPTVPTIFTAVDKFSPAVKAMEKNSSSLAAKMETSFARVDRQMRKIQKGAMNIATKSAAIGLAVAAPLGLAAKSAIDFEDKMADVAKVANVTIGSGAFQQISDQAKTIGVHLGIGANEAAGLMENLASGGIPVNQLMEVATIAGQMGVAFGISGDEAGTAFVKTRNALGLTNDATSKLMDSINFLGNTTAAKSDQILRFMEAGGAAAGRAADASGEAVAAMGASLIAMGKSPEEAATTMERFTKNVLMDKGLRKTFEEAGGGAAGMMSVIQKGAQMSGKAQDAYFQKFGAYGLSLQLLAKNYGAVEKTVGEATNAQLTNNSVLQEFNNRTATTSFKIKQAQAQFNNLAIEIGSVLLPVINKILQKAAPLISAVVNWAKENPKLVSTIVLVAGALGGLAFVVSIVSGVVAALASPITLIVIGVGLLITLIATIISYWNEWGAALSIFLGPLGLIISLIQSFRRNWDLIVQAFKTGGILEGIKMIGKTLLDAVLMPLQQLLEIASKIPGKIGAMAGEGAAKIAAYRASLGVNTTTDESGNPLPNSSEMLPTTTQATITQRQEQNQNVNINVSGPKDRTDISTDSKNIPIVFTPSLQF